MFDEMTSPAAQCHSYLMARYVPTVLNWHTKPLYKKDVDLMQDEPEPEPEQQQKIVTEINKNVV